MRGDRAVEEEEEEEKEKGGYLRWVADKASPRTEVETLVLYYQREWRP